MRILIYLSFILFASVTMARDVESLNSKLMNLRAQLYKSNSIFYPGYNRVFEEFQENGKPSPLLNHLVYIKHISEKSKHRLYKIPDLTLEIDLLRKRHASSKLNRRNKLFESTEVILTKIPEKLIREEVRTVNSAARTVDTSSNLVTSIVDKKKLTRTSNELKTNLKASTVLMLLGIAVLGGLFLVLNKWVRPFVLRRLATGRPNTIKSNEVSRCYEQLDFLQLPVISIDENEKVCWSNKTASKRYGLTIGSYFLKEHEMLFNQRYESETCNLEGDEFLVESVVNGDEEFVYFYPLADCEATSISKTKNSKTLPEAFEQALAKHNFLFTSAGIPVAVTCRSVSPGKVFDHSIEKVVKASYDLANSVRDARVNFLIDTINKKTVFQLEIINLSYEKLLSLSNNGSEENRYLEVWKEVELSLAKRQARVFIFDGENKKKLTIQIVLSDQLIENRQVV